MTYSEEDYGLNKEDEQTQARKRVLLAHISLGEQEQRRLIEYCAANIPRDRYVHPKFMSFDVEHVDDQEGRTARPHVGAGASATLSPRAVPPVQARRPGPASPVR